MLVDSLLFLMMYLLLGFIFILCGDFGVGRKQIKFGYFFGINIFILFFILEVVVWVFLL